MARFVVSSSGCMKFGTTGSKINYVWEPVYASFATRNVGQCPTWWSPCRI